MKSRFTTLDVAAAVNDLKSCEGMRVVNVYDVNHKTYIMKLSRGSEKHMLIFESGIRIHRAYHDYPKASFPSGFSQKLRKHLNNRRLCKATQLGLDRVVDLQIDDGDRAVHVIVELYDRGNIVLTDSSYVILNVLRPRTDKDNDVRFHVREKYPIPSERSFPTVPTEEEILLTLRGSDQNLSLKRAVAQPGLYNASLMEHVLTSECLNPDLQVTAIEQSDDSVSRIVNALRKATVIAQEIVQGRSAGFVSYKVEERSDKTSVETLMEYHPYLFIQHQRGLYKTYASFSEAVDAFYAVQDDQKQQQSALKIEKDAIKKLENVKKDQYRRLVELEQNRGEKMSMAELVILNQHLVDSAISTICGAVSKKTPWDEIEGMRLQAAKSGDAVASAIVKLDLGNNKIVMRLSEDAEGLNPRDVPIDIGMNANSNARELFHGMKNTAEKITRTSAAVEKAVRNAEEKAHATIQQVHVRADTAKMRKEMWFEKFLWFISSEHYIVIAGRDAQQNEMLVKRYLRPGDVYVHADAHGAASVVVRNKKGAGSIPPKTMTEASQMAICCSSSWNSHVVSSAWWVYDHQVSKVAPSGEYLPHGSFMIRGKKNFMPGCPLVLGFGILFRLDEVSAKNQKQRMMLNLGNDENDVYSAEPVEALTDRNNGVGTCEEYPDIQLDVPTVRLGVDAEGLGDYSVIELNVKCHPKKKVVTKEKETEEYLEKKKEEELKAAAPKKGGKRQKHKLEKIRTKYRDQDDDEREMRLALLGSRGRQSNASTMVEPVIASKRKDPADNGKEKCVVTESLKDPSVESRPSASNNLTDEMNLKLPLENDSRLGAVPDLEMLQISESGVEEGDVTNIDGEQGMNQDEQVFGGNVNAEGDDEVGGELDAVEDSEGAIYQLTHNPLPDDVLLYAVPMVGPYQVFGNFKYKAKITPGTSRKGKAGKTAFDLFLRMKNGDTREQTLIRALSQDDSSSRNIPKGCRISAPQLHAK